MPFERMINYICLTNVEQNFMYNDCTDFLVNKMKNFGLILVTEQGRFSQDKKYLWIYEAVYNTYYEA